MQTQLFIPMDFARRFTVTTNEGFPFCRGFSHRVLDDASKLIIGFFPVYFENFNLTPKVIDNYDEELIIKNGTIQYQLLLCDNTDNTFQQAIEINIKRSFDGVLFSFEIEAIVHKLKDKLMSAMLSGNVESNFFISKLNYKKEPL